MKLLVVGGGGREHTIIKKLKENKTVEKILLSSLRALQRVFVSASISSGISTRSGSPWKVGIGSPSVT